LGLIRQPVGTPARNIALSAFSSESLPTGRQAPMRDSDRAEIAKLSHCYIVDFSFVNFMSRQRYNSKYQSSNLPAGRQVIPNQNQNQSSNSKLFII